MRLLTNNPRKLSGLKGYGLEVVDRVPIVMPVNEHHRKYVETKKHKLGHLFGEGEIKS
jgi:3,4-dihydroxy 2-butanone 4-phosphate synthase/GTP cyclohydrolase II